MLFLAAIFSLNFLTAILYNVLYAAVFFAGLAILLTRALSKPEQWWYRCRALAESVKTLTWRYVMHAVPFSENDAQARIALRNHLHEIFRENLATANMVTSDWSGNDQITHFMDKVRAMNLQQRMEYYLKHRVDEQRTWYKNKAKANRKWSRHCVWGGSAIYLVSGFMVLLRIYEPDWQYWPTEPLILVAASIVGWMQIKKYNELAAAYTVAAHEIGLIRPMADAISTDEEFSEFVNDAEKAFSREHTLWIARKSD